MTRLIAALLLALGLLLPSPVWAQGSAAKEAVELARKAKEAFDQSQWRGALELFEQAEAKAHSPVLLLYAARCHRNLGELIAARQLFKRVIDEPLGPDAPEPFKAAQSDAAADLEAVEGRIPVVVLDRSAAPKDWRVTVDGVAVDSDEVPVDPGEHVRPGRGWGVRTPRAHRRGGAYDGGDRGSVREGGAGAASWAPAATCR